MDWLYLVKEFQTAIVGVVGFVGVITAQSINGFLARKRDEAAVDRRREAVTAAVRAELIVLRDAFKRVQDEKSPQKGSMSALQKVNRPVSNELMSEIGFLKTNSLETILEVLLTVDTMQSNLRYFATTEDERSFKFSAAQWSHVVVMHKNMAKKLQKALDILDS